MKTIKYKGKTYYKLNWYSDAFSDNVSLNPHWGLDLPNGKRLVLTTNSVIQEYPKFGLPGVAVLLFDKRSKTFRNLNIKDNYLVVLNEHGDSPTIFNPSKNLYLLAEYVEAFM